MVVLVEATSALEASVTETPRMIDDREEVNFMLLVCLLSLLLYSFKSPFGSLFTLDL